MATRSDLKVSRKSGPQAMAEHVSHSLDDITVATPQDYVLIDALLHDPKVNPCWGGFKISDLPLGYAITQATPEERARIAIGCVDRLITLVATDDTPHENRGSTLNSEHQLLWKILEAALIGRYDPNIGDLRTIISWIATDEFMFLWSSPSSPILRILEKRAKITSIPSDFANLLRRWSDSLEKPRQYGSGDRRLIPRINKLCTQITTSHSLQDILPELPKDIAPPQQETEVSWRKLIEHCRTASGAQPSTKWNTTALSLIDAIGSEKLVKYMVGWFPVLGQPRAVNIDYVGYKGWQFTDPSNNTHEIGIDTIRGLLWVCALAPNAEIVRTLFDVVKISLKKLPGVGPRYPKLANAGVYALGQLTDKPATAEIALGQLANLKMGITFRTTINQIEKSS